MQSSSTSYWAWLPRLVYIHNPFYLISAFLVLVGLYKALGDNSSLAGSWLLMGMLCGYIVLLAASGYVIVRFGQVWQDARMILLVILLLFVALSVSFDMLVLDEPVHGARFLLLGLAFAAAVTESLLLALGIRLRAAYRLPFYLVLVLLFVYPLGLGLLSVEGQDDAMAWGVFLFPWAAALVLLTLWPAARTQGELEPPNGTPWSWPWFPWSLFVFLLVAIILRSYSLSMVFEAQKGTAASFQSYFLIPLVLAGALLVLEAGLANRSRGARAVAMLLPALALMMSLPGADINPVASRFLSMLSASVGSPAQLALAGATLFYAMVWLRGIRGGELGVIACLAVASWVDAETIGFSTVQNFQPWPMAAVAIWGLAMGMWQGSCWRVTLGSLAGIMSGMDAGWFPAIGMPSAYIICHASAVLLLVIAALYDDRSAQVMRRWLTPAVGCAAIVAAMMYERWLPDVPFWYHVVYVSGLCSIAVLYWRRYPAAPERVAMLASFAALAVIGSRGAYLALKGTPLDKGLLWLIGGMFTLMVALLLSFIKGGLLFRGWRPWRAIQ